MLKIARYSLQWVGQKFYLKVSRKYTLKIEINFRKKQALAEYKRERTNISKTSNALQTQSFQDAKTLLGIYILLLF